MATAQKINEPGWIAGNGRTAAGKNTGYVLKPRSNGCPADFNDSGTTDVPDIFAFLSLWFVNDPRADFDGSGLPVAVPDIFAFLAAWFVGCP